MTRERRFQDVPRRIDVHGARSARWRRLAEVERVDPSVVLPDHHESATTDVSRDWMDHRERERHGYGGVDRVAAAAQNIHADVARERMRCHHHGMLPG